MQAVISELPMRRKHSSKPPWSSLEPPIRRDPETWSASPSRIGRNEGGDVVRIVGAVRIDEDRDLPVEMGDDRADRLPLASAVVEDDADAQRTGEIRRPVRGMAVHDEDVARDRAGRGRSHR